MSVYIKGMEMPDRCFSCPMCDTDCCGISRGSYIEYREIDVDVAMDGRPKWCPLVPVPPHGRLIDADAFAAEMKKRQDACAAWRDDIKNGGGYGTELYYRADSFLGAMYETKLTLDKMPTIIPAEPPKEET